MKIPNNGKKKEKYYLYKLVTFKYNMYTHSLSFTPMAKLSRRRRQHKTTKTSRNKITTTPKALNIPK